MCAMIITAYYSFRKFETMHTVVSLWLSKLGSWKAQFWILAQKVLCYRWTLDLPAVTCFTDSRRKGSMKTAISLGSKAKKSSRLTFDHAGLKQSSICWDFRWLTVDSWRCNGMRQLCQHGPGDHDTVSTFRELHRWRNSHSTGSARCERCEDVAGDHRDSKHLEASRSISKLSYSNVLDSRWVSPEDWTRGSPRGNREVWIFATAFRGGAVHSAWWFHREVLASGGQKFGQRCRPVGCF